MHKKISNYLSILTGTLLIATSFLPFKSIYSFRRIDNHSRAIFKVESTINFSTVYYGYESIEYLLSIALIVLIILISQFAKEPFKNIFAIIMSLVFYFGMLYTFILGEIGDSKLYLSFPILLVCSSYLIFRSMQHAFKK